MNTELTLSFRKALQSDHADLESIRRASFAPVFASFRKILGDEIYALAQKREDEEQTEILSEMFSEETTWQLFVAELDSTIVGFVSIQINLETTVGEIGLNAVSPSYSGQGMGTKMYEFANTTMKNAGMRVATVATGGDKSHLPARKAYEKAGFNVQIPSVWYCRTL